MKNFVLIILVLFLSVSCKKELTKEPKRLIEKGKMVDIMYDLSILDAIKYQNPLSLDSTDSSPKKFIFQKYKVDSLQFAQSNMYYATDYESYKDMFDEVAKRLEKNQKKVDSLVKIEEKKAEKAAKEKKKKEAKSVLKPEEVKPLKKSNLDSIRKTIKLNKTNSKK
ncbi:DUF4296 domain-containing protein [Flavobacterium sp. ANB]|uniref:DUF4296 domain-containing protein n=1 Tax=unclassified Flavobacterium TaxID=196869 RepID=UPI0012B91284|nr:MULTISPECIES: DUF4296 domain-containing protein [unclassified Flavobacterium]MBF4517392.1 DUF4296 domain-containing protein [Flavobacterium sp. ANB]MTD70768.1 DUF4296 domain-containing protein [Flavobacterium sp. LC2016-13]